MHNSVLILGRSGTGKTASMRNLDEKTTFFINVLDKSLPFRGGSKKYKAIKSWDDKEGNYFASKDWQKILKCIQVVVRREDIKTLIIDDLTYIMTTEYINRANEESFKKYVEIAAHITAIVDAGQTNRPDLVTFFIAHSEIDNAGVSVIQTIGKLLNNKLVLEGKFTITFHSMVVDGEYKFLTQHDGYYLARSPIDMFAENYIDNDLVAIQDAIIKYNEGE